jgi:hypothetical protein
MNSYKPGATPCCHGERMLKITRFFVLVAALAACVVAFAAPPSTPTQWTPAMAQFAFLFRPTRAVAPADLPVRNAAARDWALMRRREGSLQAANLLEDSGFTVTQQGTGPVVHEHALVSVLIIQAKDLESAVALAKGHPGLAFGTEIEVRPVKVVALPPP